MNPALLVKVCGLTTAADAVFAAAAGADLLGFVVHPPSPRHCADLVGAVAAVRERAVLVMVADDPADLARTADRAGLRRIQPHGRRRAQVAAALQRAGFEVLLPWLDQPGQEPLEGCLYLWEPGPANTGLEGGSGLANPLAHPPPGHYLLAGGLDGGNLADRIAALPASARAYLRGFDAASRLERAPGLKDETKVRAYLAAARDLEPGGIHAL